MLCINVYLKNKTDTVSVPRGFAAAYSHGVNLLLINESLIRRGNCAFLFVPTSFALWKHIYVSPVARSDGLALESGIVQMKCNSIVLNLYAGNNE